MDLRRSAAVLTLAAACWAAPAAAEKRECQMLPPEVGETALYAGFSESRMCEAGLKPLWQDLPDGAAQVLRFTFSSGHALFWRSVTITQLPDGSGRLEVVGGGYGRRGVRSPWADIRKVRRRLSADVLAALAARVEEAGAFDHEVGTWDQRADADGKMRLYLHCQLLEMERADAAGYRFSSVNIGCNRPEKLMPLVDEVIRLGNIDMVRVTWAGYP